MEKLYKRIDGTLHYRESWVDNGILTEHWGVVGERGQYRESAVAKDQTAEEAIDSALQPALESGYRPIDINEHAVLLIEYRVDGFGTSADLEKRHELEDRMNETLGWTGLGMCDGGSIGSGTMEVVCFVVDFDIAKDVIVRDLAGTKFADYTRIYRQDRD
jgi:hypothetical protein